MYKSICVVLIFFIYSSPIYASELSNQARDDIESIIYKAINQSGLGYKHVVGIVPPKIQRKIHRTKFYGLVEESMESIFASRSRLADRDRLKEIENKMKLIEEIGETADGAQLWLDGTTAFEGVPLSLLEGIDFFVWSNVKQISQEKVNIKISILEIKDLRSGIASGETKWMIFCEKLTSIVKTILNGKNILNGKKNILDGKKNINLLFIGKMFGSGHIEEHLSFPSFQSD